MKIIERVAIVIMLIGIFFRSRSWGGGSLLFVYSLLILIVFYFILSFAYFNSFKFKDLFSKTSYKRAGWKRIIAAFVTGYLLAITLSGILYKVMHYRGGMKPLLIGSVILIPVILTSFYFFMTRKTTFSKMIFIRTLIIAVMGFIVLLKF